MKKSGAGGGGMVKKSGAGGGGMVKKSGAGGEGMVKKSGAGGEGMVKRSGAGGEDVVGKETKNAGGVQELPGSEWPRDQRGLETSELGEGPGEETPSPEVVDGGKSCESLDAAGTGAVTQGNPNMAALVVASTDPHGEQEGTEDERGDEASWPRNPGKREMETTDLKGADNQPKDDAEQANCGPSYLASATRWPSSSLEGDRNGQLLQQLNLDLTHLTPLEQTKLRDCLLSSADVFALGASELGTTRLIQHGIKTGDHSPIKQPPRRVPFALRKTVDTVVEGMLSQGVVVPSASPWASPVVLVQKKDGGTRFCVDYRKLNHITKLDEFPLPRIDETLDLLARAKYFTTLDLASGYWQVPMEPTAQEKTAFVTHCGLYEFTKMPFGLVNAPATFQQLMELVLSGLARDKCHIYLDDVLVFRKTLEAHNQNLTEL